ncbi:MAG TPA: DUF3306 domain-containing protein [Hyphomicrobiaceae bacterium]|nr:DUF3306 domain-containing protein [Hyphomicrobiaceae bacterium]
MHKLIGALSLVPALVLLHIFNAEGLDPPSLPSIESISATTDLRPFLAPGVPGELKLAALRRAWVTDPRIRDFRGFQANAWDFSDPSRIPGFGPLAPSARTKGSAAAGFAESGGKIASGE